MRLIQIEKEMQRIRQGFIQGIFEADEVGSMRNDLQKEKDELASRLSKESNALDEAYFKTAQHFLETFQIIADKYKTADSDVKREILNLFFSKRTLNKGNLILKPSPIIEEIAVIANLSSGRGERTRTSGLMVPNHAL